MELRGRKNFAKEIKDYGREAADKARETADELAERTKELSHTALEAAQSGYHVAQEKTAACLKFTDQALRTNPYAFLGIAVGIGILIGVLARRD
jgi:ElaB/YqjD/DUF883 family membrane-anchored ribosome-binding protein